MLVFYFEVKGMRDAAVYFFSWPTSEYIKNSVTPTLSFMVFITLRKKSTNDMVNISKKTCFWPQNADLFRGLIQYLKSRLLFHPVATVVGIAT